MISLSYIMTTRNKLASLRHTLPQLLAEVGPDEEVIVIDGQSDDGSAALLAQRHNQGEIHQYISEPDYGEAHALNKALLLARGQLIKIVTDDDVFYWPAVRACKDFLMQYSDIHAVFSTGGDTDWQRAAPIFSVDMQAGFLRWAETRTPVALPCLGMMLRRSVLPLCGLFHTAIVPVDHEFSLRLSSTPARLAYYTGPTFVRIINPQSNSVAQYDKVEQQIQRIQAFYRPGLSGSSGLSGMAAEARQVASKAAKTAAHALRRRWQPNLVRRRSARSEMPWSWPETLIRCGLWLADEHKQRMPRFLFPDPQGPVALRELSAQALLQTATRS